MVEVILVLMAIASGISLLIVSPRDLHRRAILAWRECEEMELSRAHGRGDDGYAATDPINNRSDSDPFADVIRDQILDDRTVCAKEKL
jgi:hypothetical protein